MISEKRKRRDSDLFLQSATIIKIPSSDAAADNYFLYWLHPLYLLLRIIIRIAVSHLCYRFIHSVFGVSLSPGLSSHGWHPRTSHSWTAGLLWCTTSSLILPLVKKMKRKWGSKLSHEKKSSSGISGLTERTRRLVCFACYPDSKSLCPKATWLTWENGIRIVPDFREWGSPVFLFHTNTTYTTRTPYTCTHIQPKNIQSKELKLTGGSVSHDGWRCVVLSDLLQYAVCMQSQFSLSPFFQWNRTLLPIHFCPFLDSQSA